MDYSQFVDDTVLQVVEVGIGRRDILRSRDANFNDIDLRRWDMISPAVHRHIKQKAKDAGACVSVSFLIAIEKEAAKKIKENARQGSFVTP